MTESCLVDCHVHFHPCYDTDGFFDGAVANFARAARQIGLAENTIGALMLSECAWHQFFQKFSNGFVAGSSKRWSIRETNEDCSLIACRDGEPALVLVAGRQIITAENLEVLALGCNRAFPDGMPLDAVVESTTACGAVTVLPWGFGKWWGKRGQVIDRVLAGPLAEKIYLGDNAGRPRVSPRPPAFARAEQRGVPILPGTDTLGFAYEAGRVGRYGLQLGGPITLDTPAADIKRHLEASRTQPRIYGRRVGWLRFGRLQLALRLRKMTGRRGTDETMPDAAT
jgi:hypothetical protein